MRLDYIIKRIGLFILIVWLAATVNFIGPRLAGQDPVKHSMMARALVGGYVQQGMDQMAKENDKKSRKSVANTGTPSKAAARATKLKGKEYERELGKLHRRGPPSWTNSVLNISVGVRGTATWFRLKRYTAPRSMCAGLCRHAKLVVPLVHSGTPWCRNG